MPLLCDCKKRCYSFLGFLWHRDQSTKSFSDELPSNFKLMPLKHMLKGLGHLAALTSLPTSLWHYSLSYTIQACSVIHTYLQASNRLIILVYVLKCLD